MINSANNWNMRAICAALMIISCFNMNAILNEYEYDWGYNKGEEVVFGDVTYAINIEARTAGVRHFNKSGRNNPMVCHIPSYITYYGIDYRVNSIPDTAFYDTSFTELSIPETVTRLKNCVTPHTDTSNVRNRFSFDPSYNIDLLNINSSPCPVDSFGRGFSYFYSGDYYIELYQGLPGKKIKKLNIGRDGSYFMGAILESYYATDETRKHFGYYSGRSCDCTIDTVIIKDNCKNVKLEINCGKWDYDHAPGGLKQLIVEHSDVPLDTLVITNRINEFGLYKSCNGTIKRNVTYIDGDIGISALEECFDTFPSFYHKAHKSQYFTFKSPNIKLSLNDIKDFWGIKINENNTPDDFSVYCWAIYNKDRDSLLWAYPRYGDDMWFHFAPELKTIKRGTIFKGSCTAIAFHDGIEEIEDYAFEELGGVFIDGSLNGLKRVGNNSLCSSPWIMEIKDFGTRELLAIEEIGDSAFYDDKFVTTVILGPNIKKIGKHAFGKKMLGDHVPTFPTWEETMPIYRICILADEVPECGEIFSRDMFYDEEQADKWHYRNFEFYVPAHMVEKYRNCDQDFRNYPIYDIAQYKDPAGIDEVTDYAPEAEPQYYNLTGTQITNPTPGHLYIVKRGNRVTKELFHGL